MKFLIGLLFTITQLHASAVIPNGGVTLQKLASQTSESSGLQNCTIAAAVSANALTISIKDAAGNNPQSAAPASQCRVAFRSATASTGSYANVLVSAATSVVVSNGSALGCTASANCLLYVYAINNAGTVVLGVIGKATLDESTLQSSTAEGGAGAADSAGVLYTTSAQSSKAVRLLGRLQITPGASFAWSAGPTEIGSNIFVRQAPTTLTVMTSGTLYTTPAGVAYIHVRMIGAGGGGGGSQGSPGAGGNGGATTFGSNSSGGGTGGGAGVTSVTPGGGGIGGANTQVDPGIQFQGSYGSNGTLLPNTTACPGTGGAGAFGGAGRMGTASAAGTTAIGVGSAGGGGCPSSGLASGGGGGAGAYQEVYISNPAASYVVSIGAAGGGGAGTFAGGAGLGGAVIVEEFYF